MNATELLGEWAAKHEIETVLEQSSGDARPACAALARRGVRVSAIVDDAAAADRARAAYGECDVTLASRLRELGELAKHDLVVIHGDDVEVAEIAALARHAVKLVAVIAPNPGAVAARLRGNGKARWGATELLAPLLWSLGRVREHAFLDVPAFAAGMPRLTLALAPSHLFVVDVTPRSPQARRKLRLSTQ